MRAARSERTGLEADYAVRGTAWRRLGVEGLRISGRHFRAGHPEVLPPDKIRVRGARRCCSLARNYYTLRSLAYAFGAEPDPDRNRRFAGFHTVNAAANVSSWASLFHSGGPVGSAKSLPSVCSSLSSFAVASASRRESSRSVPAPTSVM